MSTTGPAIAEFDGMPRLLGPPVTEVSWYERAGRLGSDAGREAAIMSMDECGRVVAVRVSTVEQE